MANRIRWNIKVAPETDLALRVHLAGRGLRKGDMSRFVEKLVLLELFGDDVAKIRPGDPDAELDLTGADVTDRLAAVAERMRLRVFEQAGITGTPPVADERDSASRKKSGVARAGRQPRAKRGARTKEK